MNHYKYISSFNKDIRLSAPEYPHLSVAFGHKANGNIDNIVFTAGFYIISFLNFVSGNITYGRKELDSQRGRLMFLTGVL